jgi:hypothetical protein
LAGSLTAAQKTLTVAVVVPPGPDATRVYVVVPAAVGVTERFPLHGEVATPASLPALAASTVQVVAFVVAIVSCVLDGEPAVMLTDRADTSVSEHTPGLPVHEHAPASLPP